MQLFRDYEKCLKLVTIVNGPKFLDTLPDYAAACMIAETIDEKTLEAVGYDWRDIKCRSTFDRLERALAVPKKAKNQDSAAFIARQGLKKGGVASQALDSIEHISMGMSAPDFVQLKAFLGSRGVKTSMLNGSTDYIEASKILWGEALGGVKSANQLLLAIARMTKNQRKLAGQNLARLPENWKA
jgi:tripartite-type tricarboxylate transporter receptor subunit TctC